MEKSVSNTVVNRPIVEYFYSDNVQSNKSETSGYF